MVRSCGKWFKSSIRTSVSSPIYIIYICAVVLSRNIKTKYPIGYLMFIITAKYWVSKWTIKQTGLRDSSLRTYTNTYIHKKKGRRGMRGRRAHWQEARTDIKDIIITYLNIDQLKLERYGPSTSKKKIKWRRKKKRYKENKSGVNPSRSWWVTHCWCENQSV